MTPHQALREQVARLSATLLLLGDVAFLRDSAEPLGLPLDDPDALADRLAQLREQLPRELEKPERCDEPLARLRSAFELSALDVDLLLLAMLPELDDRFGALFAQMRGRGDVRRPTVGLAFRAVVERERRDVAWPALRRSPLWSSGLLLPQDDDLPFPDRTLRPTAAAVAALEGRVAEQVSGRWHAERIDPLGDEGLDLAVRHWRRLSDQAAELAEWLSSRGLAGVVHVATDSIDAGRMLAGALAHHLALPCVRVRSVAAEPVAALRESAVSAAVSGAILSLDVTADVARIELPRDVRLAGPTIIITSPRCSIDVSAALALRRVAPERPRPIEHRELWRTLLSGIDHDRDPIDVDLLSSQTWLPVSEIERAVARAQTLAWDGRPGRAELARALGELPEPSSALARVRRPRVGWGDLVLPAATLRGLEDIVRRVRHRATVQDAWGLRASHERGDGVVALFHGEPGTGKTLAVDALAARLGLSVVAVDLSQVTSKFIGETEKNLAQAFEAVEGYRAVLFFDEAESLFGKRTAVSTSHDRYANLETNYLLQRLETLEGICILATNLRQNIDDAFARRLHAVVAFPRPSEALQQRLWELHVPGEPGSRDAPRARGDDIDLAALAKLDLVGGEIKNAATAAAYAAAAARGPITQALLERAVREELDKRGRVGSRRARDGTVGSERLG